MKHITSVLLAVLLCLNCNMLAQNRKVLPPTNMITDPSLIKFIDDLKSIVKEKNKTKLLTMVNENVMSYFDGENTKASFENNWFTSDPPGDIWYELGRSLDRKGDYMIADYTTKSYLQDEYYFPYALNFDFSEMDDIFTYAIIIGSDVNLRSEPSITSSVITKLNYEVVKMVYENDQHQTAGTISGGKPEWYKIESEDKKYKGWINHKFIYSPLDYRLYLVKKEGKWKISAFISGD